jgi:hypothetical protein
MTDLNVLFLLIGFSLFLWGFLFLCDELMEK